MFRLPFACDLQIYHSDIDRFVALLLSDEQRTRVVGGSGGDRSQVYD